MEGLPFRQVWAVDFEFYGRDGDLPTPVCMVARELRSDTLVRLWQDGLGPRPPFSTAPDVLVVAYFASAELGCYLALGWPTPERILDLFTEFRAITNGLHIPCGRGLLGALAYHGLDSLAADEKAGLRELILTGGPWSRQEKVQILDYCQSDVDALAQLLPRMLPGITRRRFGLGQALLRGRYMAAVARMERTGVPVDTPTLARLRELWDQIKRALVTEIDKDFGVYENGSFVTERFAHFLGRERIPWPRLDSGQLDLKDDTFREMARGHPRVAPLRELRFALSQLRLNDLAVGVDGRNRTLLSPFRSRSGRNQPSNTKFVFGPSTWVRSLIKPAPGRVLAYIDWSAQEIAVAGALSGDEAMMEAYSSGDPYAAFAIQAKLAPPEATKRTHPKIRDLCKTTMLAVQYGMERESLAHRLGIPAVQAGELLALHRRTYRAFWQWSDAALDTLMLRGTLTTVFGWPVHAGTEVNPRSIRNQPMQANGAEMLRLATSLATERGLMVCAPVHDAVLLEVAEETAAEEIAAMQESMAEASRVVLGGFEVRTDVNLIRWPDRYSDRRGEVMWARVMGLLDRLEEGHRFDNEPS